MVSWYRGWRGVNVLDEICYGYYNIGGDVRTFWVIELEARKALVVGLTLMKERY